MAKKKNYCAYVDKGMRLHFMEQNGQLYLRRKPCCNIANEFTESSIRKFVPVSDAKDIFEHPSNSWYKQYFKRSSNLPPDCNRCILQEKVGIKSPRLGINQKQLNNEHRGYDINRLDIVLGNECNLACPFCDPSASSLIAKTASKMDTIPFNWDIEVDAQQPKLGTFIADILKTYKVHTFKVIGGEPFLKNNWDQIGEALEQGYAQDCNFEVTTNGTIINQKVLDQLAQFKTSLLRISIDGIHSNYDFIRWPHKFEKMAANLKFLQENKADNIQFKINPLLNILNLEYASEMEKWFTDNGYIDQLWWSCEIKPVHHPLNYSNAPVSIIEHTKEQVSEHLQKRLVHNPQVPMAKIREQVILFLQQRKMQAQDVLGPLTRKWLEL